MNKLEGLYELKTSKLPTVDWNIFEKGTHLSNEFLWTIRTAVYRGRDLLLPGMFGQPSDVAEEFAEHCLKQLNGSGVVIYYPYMKPEKSGVLQFDQISVCLEGVLGDVKQVLHGKTPDALYRCSEDGWKAYGNQDLFSGKELEQLYMYVQHCRKKYKDTINMGGILQMEFSYAYKVDCNLNKCEDVRLCFFEMRTI